MKTLSNLRKAVLTGVKCGLRLQGHLIAVQRSVNRSVAQSPCPFGGGG